MKIEGRVTILFSHDGMTIEVRDEKANVTFAEIILNQEQTCQALSRLGRTHCEIDVNGLENVGKKYEHERLTFEMDDRVGKDEVYQCALKHCPEGWIVLNYFNSQDTFRYLDNGKLKVSCTIYRWV